MSDSILVSRLIKRTTNHSAPMPRGDRARYRLPSFSARFCFVYVWDLTGKMLHVSDI